MNISGTRVLIRPTVQDDLPFLRTLWNDGQVMRYLGYPEGMHVTDEGMAHWWALTPQTHGEKNNNSSYLATPHCMITLLDGTLIGEFDYSVDNNKRARVDLKLAMKFWGQGYATEALTLALRELFATGAADRVMVEPSPENTAAHELYKRCGFRPKPTEDHPYRWECRRAEFDARPLETI